MSLIETQVAIKYLKDKIDDAINAPIELSSMGIRVNKESLLKQLEFKNELDKVNNPYF